MAVTRRPGAKAETRVADAALETNEVVVNEQERRRSFTSEYALVSIVKLFQWHSFLAACCRNYE